MGYYIRLLCFPNPSQWKFNIYPDVFCSNSYLCHKFLCTSIFPQDKFPQEKLSILYQKFKLYVYYFYNAYLTFNSCQENMFSQQAWDITPCFYLYQFFICGFIFTTLVISDVEYLVLIIDNLLSSFISCFCHMFHIPFYFSSNFLKNKIECISVCVRREKERETEVKTPEDSFS